MLDQVFRRASAFLVSLGIVACSVAILSKQTRAFAVGGEPTIEYAPRTDSTKKVTRLIT